jgi:hypothetical protein
MVAEIALIIAAVGAGGAVFALRQAYRQRLHQIEAMYVQRFWVILDRFSLMAISKRPPERTICEADEKAIRAYIRLCEDELEVRAEGWIGDTAYKIWRTAIRVQMQLPAFNLVWQRVHTEDRSLYKRLALLLDEDEGRSYDPCGMPTWRRWVHGLTGMRGA